MRLIDADEAEKALAEQMAYEARMEFGGRQKADDYLLIARAYFQNCPTIDAKPVQIGKWKTWAVAGSFTYTCRACGFPSVDEYNYCPNCGAQMEG